VRRFEQQEAEMAESPFIFDVTETDFEQKVMRRSLEVPVLVDFWAPWCGPCRTLTPTLEKLAVEYGGRFELAKINVDVAQQIAQIFRIQSIPTVYLFVGGQPVDGFQGAQPASAIKQILDKHIPDAPVDPMELARAAFAEGRMDDAQAAFVEALAEEEGNTEALLGLARIAISHGDLDVMEAWLNKIPVDDPAEQTAERLRQVAAFSKDAGDLNALQAQVQADPDDVAAWYALGATHASRNELPAACQAFLKVVALDRGFREDAGRTALLSIFDLLGPEDPIVGRYRKRLAGLLF
jgi:putative thioredoxin